jgi:hypothetical protein
VYPELRPPNSSLSATLEYNEDFVNEIMQDWPSKPLTAETTTQDGHN